LVSCVSQHIGMMNPKFYWCKLLSSYFFYYFNHINESFLMFLQNFCIIPWTLFIVWIQKLKKFSINVEKSIWYFHCTSLGIPWVYILNFCTKSLLTHQPDEVSHNTSAVLLYSLSTSKLQKLFVISDLIIVLGRIKYFFWNLYP